MAGCAKLGGTGPARTPGVPRAAGGATRRQTIMMCRNTQVPRRRPRRGLSWAGLLLACALATPLAATLLLAAQLEPNVPRPGPEAAHHGAHDPAPPSHERHGPVCFLCVLGPVLLAVPPVRLRRRPRAVPEPRLRWDFPARVTPSGPQSRSRAPPHPARPGSRHPFR